MSLENQVARVSQGTKDTLKTLINKLGGNVTDELIDQYPSIASTLADAPFKPAGKSYLTFSSPNSFTLKVYDATKHWDGTLEYFASDKTWTTWDGTATLSAVDNDGEYVLYLRGTGNTTITGNDPIRKWILTGANVKCNGNIENLLDYATVESGEHPTMAEYCYNYMFDSCASLTQAPALPATTLANFCYCNMFSGCTGLTQAPALPATTLANYCYNTMFRGCTGLTQAPALPATTLGRSCYVNMFSGCTSLTQAPALPATTLANYCYSNMFNGCTSLTKVPALPATTLVIYCYYNMFYGCTKIKVSSTQTGEYAVAYRIPTDGTGTTATDALTDMFASTGGTFTGTPEINTTYYLSSDNMVVRETEIATLNGYVGSMIDSVTPESIGAAAATHASQHASNGSDPITPASIGALPTSGGAMTGDLIINSNEELAFKKLIGATQEYVAGANFKYETVTDSLGTELVDGIEFGTMLSDINELIIGVSGATNKGLVKITAPGGDKVPGLHMNGHRIGVVGDPIFLDDAATKRYVDSKKSVSVYTATIGTTWTENEDTGVKSQSISISGVLSTHTAKVDHAYTGSGTSDDYAAFVEAENQYLTYITNGYAETYDGGITFYIFGDAPTVEIPIVVEVA